MPQTTSSLIEYLLAIDRPVRGGKLCRFGAMQTTVLVFPPGTAITYAIYPYFNAHANIEFYHIPSPAMVPGAFYWHTTHAGVEVAVGTVRNTALAEGRNLWIEVSQAFPIITTVENISGLVQFFETVDLFLIVDTPEDLNDIRKIVANYNTQQPVVDALQETNNLLRDLFCGIPLRQAG